MNLTTEKILLKYDPDIANLLTALKDISAAFGYVSRADAKKIADYFSAPLSKVFETATFYDEIKVRKDPALVIEVCSSSNCALGNSSKVIKEIENIFHIKEGDDFNPKVRLKAISCLGHCGEGPIMVVNGNVYTRVTVNSAHGILAEYL